MITDERFHERFWSKVKKTSTGCWEWTGIKTSKGYGRFRVVVDGQYQVMAAHRYAWVLEGRELPPYRPDGLQLDHGCDNRLCVNVDHLRLMTSGENNRRGQGFAGKNARKTSCPKGHPYDGENLILRAKGGRRCRECVNAERRRREKAKREARGPVDRKPITKTHCKRGHPLEGANVWIPPSEPWHRCCRICRAARKKSYRTKHE